MCFKDVAITTSILVMLGYPLRVEWTKHKDELKISQSRDNERLIVIISRVLGVMGG